MTDEEIAKLEEHLHKYGDDGCDGDDVFRVLADLEKAKAEVVVLREALTVAHAYLDGEAGWSGAAGNWPLQNAETVARAALAKVRT